MSLEIPLQSGSENAHQSFTISLGGSVWVFTLDWQTLAEYWAYNVDINGERVISGGVLAAGTIINRHDTANGSLELVGRDATLLNLGAENTLVWHEPV